MVALVASRQALADRVSLVGEHWSELYPGVQAPQVYDGYPSSEPPYYIAVDSVVSGVTVAGESTIGAGRWEWTVNVVCMARHVSQKTASDTCMAYAEAVMSSVMADQRLGGTVDNSFVSIQAEGATPDNSKRYIAAAQVQVRMAKFSHVDAAMREVIKG